MSLFNGLFRKRGDAASSQSEPREQVRQQNLVSTRQDLPIDNVHDFLKKDFETKGVMNAQSNPEKQNRDSNKNLIKRDFEILVRETIIEYEKRIQTEDTKISIQKSAGNSYQVAVSEQNKKLYLDHIERINGIKQDFDAGKPEVVGVLTSYDIGFDKGIIILTNQL